MSDSEFLTPGQAARKRRDAAQPFLAPARSQIRKAMLKEPNHAGEHWIQRPRGLTSETIEILRAELAKAGWSLRVESSAMESNLIIQPDGGPGGRR